MCGTLGCKGQTQPQQCAASIVLYVMPCPFAQQYTSIRSCKSSYLLSRVKRCPLLRSSIYISYIGRLAGAKTRCINNVKGHPSVKMETFENFLLYYIRSTVLTMDVSSTVNAQAAIGLWWPLNWWIILPTAMSHSPTVSSQLQEANRAPLPGENCTFVTPYLWPTSFWAAAYTEIIIKKCHFLNTEPYLLQWLISPTNHADPDPNLEFIVLLHQISAMPSP